MHSLITSFARLGSASIVLSCVVMVGCSSESRDPILNLDGVAVLAPTVTAVTPIEDASSVAMNTLVTATFDQTMAPIAGASRFEISCDAPCVAPTGTVAFDASERVATFTHMSGRTFDPTTRYTGTITAAVSRTTGVAMTAPFIWRFTTGVRPTVTAVAPLANATGVPINTASITASFSEPMAPITGSASFTLSCAAPCTTPSGSVTLDATSRIATLTFASGTTLFASTLYTATVTDAASLGNGLTLELPFVWRFTTGAAPDLTRPRVTLTTPVTTVPGPTAGVPINSAISAVFTEAMAPSSITGTTTFTLSCVAPCVAPAGTVAYSVSTQTATFTAATLLAPGTTYVATIATAATDLAGNALAGNQSPLPAASAYLWSFTTQATPTVTAVAPLDGAVAVAINNTVITAAFSEPMAPLTGSASFTVTCSPPCANPIGTVALDATSRIATFTLGSGVVLQPLTLYTATVTGATSLATGLAIANPYIWRFTTGVAPDLTRPRVTLTTPVTTVPGPTTGVLVGTTIAAVFTEDMAPATINTTSVTLGCLLPCVAPAGTVTYSVGTRTALFTPSSPLASDTTYSARITAFATDLAGNALGGNQAALPAASSYLWTFTTQARPTVTAVAPLDNATSVPINNTLITAAFSEAMAPISGLASFTVTCAAPCSSPAGTVSLDGTALIATFALGSGVTLEPLTLYTATVTAAASATTGLRLASPFVWQFTTGVAPDTTRPGVISTTPATTIPGPTLGVPATTAITAVFSEDMAPAGINTTSVTLACVLPCVAPTGTVTYSVATRTALFTPAAALAAGTTYSARITTLATDLAGNALGGNQAALPAASSYLWTFTTQARPTVTAVAPLDNAINVPINNTLITAAFSEAMAPISGVASFTVTCAAPCASPTGTVSLDVTQQIATFALGSGVTLQPLTLYTATVTAAASATTGLRLASPFVWQFTTGVAPDTTRPGVISTTPVTTIPGPTTGVPTTTAIAAVFSEDMAPAGINATSVTLTCVAPCLAPSGTVTYSVATRTASFVPVAVLAANTTYTLAISSVVSDLAGNALGGNQAALPAASAYIWTFTTQARPTVTAVAPLDNATNVPINNTVITAAFSEAMAPITGPASFTVTCAAPCVSPAGTVSLDGTSRTATFALGSGVTLEPLTLYTATVTGASSSATGLALASPFVWRFTTGVAPDTTRPRVTLTTPVTSVPGPTLGVPITTVMSAVFTEDMAPASLGATTVTLTCVAPCVTPAGTVAYSVATRTATFTPSAVLVPGTTYTATITTAATDLAGNALAGNQAALPAASAYRWTFTTQARPTVTAVAPLDNATNVPINNTVITAAFSEPMAPLTGGASFTVTCSAPCASPTGTVSFNGTFQIATFALGSGGTLEPLTLYTATVTGATSLATGLTLASPFVWHFTTGVAPDTTRPAVISTTPVTTIPGPTTNVPITTALAAVFSEDMAPGSIDAFSFTVGCFAPCVSPVGTVSYSVATRTATFTPSASLEPATTYNARITALATDLAGNALGGNQAALPAASSFLWTFTTQARPTVSAVVPLDNATGVPINNTVITAAFSEPMAPITGSASFTVTCAAPCVSPAGTVSLNGAFQIATFTLGSGVTLQPLTLYTATVTGARSLATGLALASPFVWQFTTGVAPDTTRPRVTLTVPVTSVPGPTTGVPNTTVMSAVFTEDMAPASITATSVRLTCVAPCVSPAGTVSYSVGTRTATFTPAAALQPGTTYTATVTIAATDLAGNALAGNQAALPAASAYLWTFTTQARPTVTAVVPLDNATAVPINNTIINAAFSEAMAPITGAASFTVTCAAPCSSPAGSVSLDPTSRIATFALGSGVTLEPLTLYTATVTGATSLTTGLALASPFVWHFTTGVAPDTTAPTVILTVPVTTPAGITSGVPITTVISATFSEAMAPASLTGASFTRSCAAPCVAPTGVVAYSVGTRTVSFTPSAPLAVDTVYTITITAAATDLAGNALAGGHVWSFRTQARPTVIAVTPLDNATGVPISDPLITATFSEAVAPLTGGASFTLTCAAPCVNPVGTVALDGTSRIARFTLGSGTTLAPLTLYTATVTGATSLATTLALANPFVWSFTSGATPDTVRPQVSSTVPATTLPGPTPDVPVGTPINAVFTEPMDTATLGGASISVTCVAPCTDPAGSVSYTPATRTLRFVPSLALDASTTYTVTIAASVADLAGNTLAGNQAALPAGSAYEWSFTTQARPTVTAVAPIAGATGVPIDNTIINAAFSEAMAPLTGGASFTVTCAAPCTNPAGTVSFDATLRIATFALDSGVRLEPLTLYTATVTAAASITTGLTLAGPFSWQFTTGVTPDATRPRVTVTVPVTTIPGPTIDVLSNTAITAVFSEDMAPATLNLASFTVTCTAPCISPTGTVSYAVGTRTADFLPGTVLEDSTTYTATITTAATDLAGNALAGNQAALPAASAYVWTFTTATPVPPAFVTVLSTNPASGATGVCPTATINATFNVPFALRMDPATVTTATFTIAGVTAASVVLDGPTGTIATFTPQSPLTVGTTYVATIKGGAAGVKDLAVPGNEMASDYSWSFTVGPATGGCLAPIPLGTATPFGMFGSAAGMTNAGTLTVINGDIGTTGASSVVTGFHDLGAGCTYTETVLNVGVVNGRINTAPPSPTPGCPSEGTAATFAIATQALADIQTAFTALSALPPGPDPTVGGNLAGLVLGPGVYTAALSTFAIQGGDLTLDGQGNADAVFVFQMATTLTVGGPGVALPQSVLLINGAQAKNVYWKVGSAAVINAGGGGTMVGTVIAQTAIAVSTAANTSIVTIEGRVLALSATVTLVNTVINVPPP